MKKRALGKTGLEVSELALGTWGLSGDGYGPVVEAEADRTIERAVALGITLFDTADVYGAGSMEQRLGRLLPKEALVCTKIGTDRDGPVPRKVFTPKHLRGAFERSRERLGRSKIDVLLLHNPTLTAVEAGEAIGYLKGLKEQGDIAAWGVAAGSVEVARAAIGREADVIEIAYNVFLAKDLADLSGDVSAHGTAVLARSVLAHGLLTGHWTADRDFGAGDHRSERWRKDDLKARVKQLEALRPLVAGSVATMRAAALRFVLSNQLVTSAVLGPRTVSQLEQLAREAGTPPYLRDTALLELGNRLRALGVAVG